MRSANYGAKRGLKMNFNILQNTYYLESGEFVRTKTELAEKLCGEDKAVMETVILLTKRTTLDFDKDYAQLFAWCQGKLNSIGI